MSIKEELQDEKNIISYSRGVYKAAKIVLAKYKEGHDALIFPTRGANPIVQGVIGTIKYLASEGDKVATKLTKSLYTLGSSDKPNEPFPIIPVPLTTDVNVPEKLLRYYGLTSDQVIDGIKEGGADTIATFRNTPEERKKNKYFKLLTWILSEIEGREGVRRFYEELPPVYKPIFLDTEPYGKPSYTVLERFDKNGTEVYPIILTDDKKGLKLDYKTYLDQRCRDRSLELIPIKRIVSENQGAALQGVLAVCYPQIMLEVRTRFDLKGSAVTCHDVNEPTVPNSILPYRDIFSYFLSLVTNVTRDIHNLEKSWGELSDQDILSLMDEMLLNEKIQTVTNAITEHDAKYKTPRVETGETIKEDFNGDRIENASETHSHVVHILFKEDYLQKKFISMQKLLSTSHI